ncbi:metallophosphoesterase [Pseudoflavitalea rhizosphaerae]|uniref:metallophosphoesterase n=1 Tax=Pseudoflavitalea rhizosphaerae TaxID=1884793 RepID=UPI000F8E6889|nr:metallophosphoesterase [Pseudoflavitalea rhizosphaerae]
MKILHISDFHFKNSKKDIAAQDLLIDKLVENLKNEKNIDFILFTGDLVFSGENKNDFISAYNSFLVKVASATNVLGRNIILCPGNHDVNRKDVSIPVKDFIRASRKGEDLTKIVENNKKDELGLSCKPTENYFLFEKKIYQKGEELEISKIGPLYSTHTREIGNKKIGFACINTAWCSTGDDDASNLFFPKSELEKAVKELKEKNVALKILLLHHPLYFLREFNKSELEDIIYSEFNIMLSGHLHKREDSLRLIQNEGIFCSYAHASFTKKEDGKIGFCIIEIDLDELEIKIDRKSYDFEERFFFSLPKQSYILPVNEEKRNQFKLFKVIRKRTEEVIEMANELFVHSKDKLSQSGFLDLFIDPVLRTNPNFEVDNYVIPNKKLPFRVLFERKNYLIFGKDKTGKTSLLYKLNIDLLKEFSQSSEIPIYINLSDYARSGSTIDFIKLLSRFLETSYEGAKTILTKYKIRLLIDNFDPTAKKQNEILNKFITEYSNCKYVIVTDQTIARSLEKIDYGIDGYEPLFIHDISRSEIRKLTYKWPSIPENKREAFVDKIIEVLKQHSMPFNYWTISIFLWIFSGKNTLNFNNNSELIDLYIDDLLDRNRLASDPENRFSYQNYKILLSELAHKLLIELSDKNYSIYYADFTTFVDTFMKANPKRVGKTSEIINYLLDRGVLKKNDDDYITFRLNGVFEYFLAFYFIENREFLNQIIDDDNIYLSFKNEFEIYSGFLRSEAENKELLNKIYGKTRCILNELNQRMHGELDLRLQSVIEGKQTLDMSRTLASIESNGMAPLTEEEKDDFFDEVQADPGKTVEVRSKKIYDVSIKRFDILERFLFINGRVFKNIENVKDEAFIIEIFDFIIESSCNIGFLLIEELEENIKNGENQEEVRYSETPDIIYQLFNNYLPSVVQTFIHESMGHINLETIILSRIDELKKNFRVNQYKLFILYCLLLDIDFKKHKSKIDELISISKMTIIKSSIQIKLFYLLLFKCYDDDRMIAFLREKIREVNLHINPEMDLKKFEQSFEKTKKVLLLKRSKDRD